MRTVQLGHPRMKTEPTLERRTFLTATAATVVASVAGCGDDEGASVRPGSPDAGGGSDATRSLDAGSSDAASSDAGQPASEAGTSALESSSTTSSTASRSSSADGASNSETHPSTGATSTFGDTSSAATSTDVPESDACFEGGGTEGGIEDAGPGVLCSTNTDNGNHCHALVVPQIDVESGISQATYLLEDGGTGHTHTVTLTAYDFFYLQAGVATKVESTEQAGHTHTCLITCSV